MKNVEIERKFLVKKSDIKLDLKKYKHSKIEQGFLYIKPAIRVRKADNKYYFTIKTKPPKDVKAIDDLARTEYEVEIPKKCYNYFKVILKGLYVHGCDKIGEKTIFSDRSWNGQGWLSHRG